MRNTEGKRTDIEKNHTETEAFDLRPQLKQTASLQLKHSDFERALGFAKELSSRYGKELTIFVRAGERSFEVPPRTLGELGDVIAKHGGLKELDYLSLFAQGELAVNFDFINRELRIRTKDKPLLARLEELWKSSPTKA